MPTYDYLCHNCQQKFDVFMSYSEYGRKPVHCTHCGSGNVKRRQPFFIQHTDGQVMTLAGIWDPWVAANGQSILSCSIITIEANATVGAIHNRMPAILEPSDADRWLDESLCPADLLSLLRPPAVDVLEAYPVDRQVIKPDEDGSACIQRIEIEPTGKLELF